MWMNVGFSFLIGFGSFCVFLSIFEIWKHQSQPEAALQPGCPQTRYAPQNDTAQNEEDDAISEELERVIDEERKMVRESMDGYKYPRGKYNTSAAKLEDLLINENGRPIRSLIISTWRSGSTFLGEIINAHPAMFYHFEPLVNFNTVQIRGPPLAATALKRVKALFNCDYTDQGELIKFCKDVPWVYDCNAYLREECREEMCYNPIFHSEMCKLFPFQAMKLIRLRLNVAQQLLEDGDLNIRMVLLVRDPRGTLQSRKHCNWCRNMPNCEDPAFLCADLSSDYKIATELVKKYPTRFRVIRYEDLSAAPYEEAEELTHFYGLDFTKNMKQFLDTHTKSYIGHVSGTFRDTKSAPYCWKTKLTFEEVEEIQECCLPAMKRWGYLPAANATHQRTFDPITDYVL